MGVLKVTTGDCIHHGFQLHEGLNTDVEPFDPATECGPGGLYFASSDSIHRWLNRPGLRWLWDVSIPEGEKVVAFQHKAKAHRIILSNPRPIPLELWRRAIRHNAAALVYAPDSVKSEDLCLDVVRRQGWLLKHVPAHTVSLKICVAAVRQYESAISYVPDKLKELVRVKTTRTNVTM